MHRIARYLRTLLFILVALSGTWRAAGAQGNLAVKIDSVDASQAPKIVARITIVDDNGLPVLDLKPENFELTEDGRTSVKPSEVKAMTNDKAPVTVLILIDLASTMRGEPLKAAKEASARFLDKLLNEAGDADRAAFIGFGEKVDIKALILADSARETAFTNDKGRLLNVVNFVEVDAAGGTPLYDALYRGVKIMAGQAGRRAIIVMTDGADVGSILKDNDPIDEARRQHIPIFPVGLSNSRLDATYLKRLAELTGGQYQEAPSPADLTQKFEEVLSELKVQYVVTFQSQWSSQDTQTHSLLVRVKTPRGQGFDETKVQIAKATATAPTTPTRNATAGAAVSTGQATGTPAPQPSATPTPEDRPVSNLQTWITDNTLLAAGIGFAAILFLMLIVLAVILMRRRAVPATIAASATDIAPPVWAGAEIPPAQPAYRAEAHSEEAAGGETVAADAGAAGGAGGTWVAPVEQPIARQPFGVPPAMPRDRKEPPADDVEGTVVLPRGPKPKVLGLLVDRSQPTRRFDLAKPSVTIGRSTSNVIVIDDPTVSRQHAVIKLEAGEFRLYDLGSANGTFVGDQRVRDPITLQDGAGVRFGEVEFIFKRVALE